jgi:hypothetical protein
MTVSGWIILVLFVLLLISIVVNFILGMLLKRRRTNIIDQHNRDVINKEMLVKKVNDMSGKKMAEVVNDIEKANSISDIADIFSNL